MSDKKKKAVSKAGSLQSLSSPSGDAFSTPPSKTPSPIGLTGTTPAPTSQPTPKSTIGKTPSPPRTNSPTPSASSISSSASVMPIPSPTESQSCALPTSPSTPGSKKSKKSKLSIRGSKKQQPSSSGSIKPKAPLKATKSKIPVNYTILISGTETESEASSVEVDTVTQFKINALAEKAYNIFRAVESGSLSGFKEAWEENPGFNINTKNPIGYTILHIAIRRQHEDLVKEILDLGAEEIWPSVLYDVLLHSTQEQSMDLVTKIYEVMEQRNLIDQFKQNRLKPKTPPVQTSQSATGPSPKSNVPKSYRTIRMTIDEKETYINSEFDPDMTPLLLAAKVDSYELVEFFCSKGHTIPDFHEHNCKCTDCGGALRTGIRRLLYYDAISKPAYLCFLANKYDNYDLFLEIFKLIDTLREIGNKQDVEFKAEYKEIRDELKEFSSSILQQCRNSGEVELLFDQNEQKSGLRKPLPRLQLAMHKGLKNIVAHPHSQQILYDHWAGIDWPEYRSYGPGIIFVHLILRFFTWPLISIWLLFDSRSNWGRFLSCPASRFLNWLASYLWFLLFLIIISDDAESTNSLGPPNTHLEFPVLIWILGYIFSMIRMLFKNTLNITWVYFDGITYVLFLGAIISGYCGMTEIDRYGGKGRKYWTGTEATLFSEAFFACATICAFLKLFRILQLHLKLGPLITAIGRMSHDVYRMFAFFAIIIFSFGLAFKRIYRPYEDWKEFKDDGSNKDKPETQGSDLTSLHSAVALLFWSLFGLGDTGVTSIVGNTIPDPTDPTGKTYMTNHAFFPQLIGKFLLIFYTIAGVNIMLNLLLGLMSKTYDLVYMERRDEEWKFARSTIWLSFIHETVNPPPFNLIPTLPCLTGMVGLNICTPKNKNPSRTKLKQADYSKLMRTLIQRYFRDKSDINNTEDAKQETVDALEEDLAELRALLEEMQQKSTRNVVNQDSAASKSKTNRSADSTPPPFQIVQEALVKSSASSPANLAFPSSSIPQAPTPAAQPIEVGIPPTTGILPSTLISPTLPESSKIPGPPPVPVVPPSVPKPPPPPPSLPPTGFAPPPPPSLPPTGFAPPPPPLPPPIPKVPTTTIPTKSGPSESPKPKGGAGSSNAAGPPSLDTIKASIASLRPTKSKVAIPSVPPLPPSQSPQTFPPTASPGNKKVKFSK